jgi:hypothetical protein
LFNQEEQREVHQFDCYHRLSSFKMAGTRGGGRRNLGLNGPTTEATDPAAVTATGTDPDTDNANDGDEAVDLNTNQPDEETVQFTPVIAKIMLLCDFPADSTMAMYIEQ